MAFRSESNGASRTTAAGTMESLAKEKFLKNR